MIEILEFIFGGTALWGTVRYAGVCFLLLIVVMGLADIFRRTRK